MNERKPRSGSRIYEGIAAIVAVSGEANVEALARLRLGNKSGDRVAAALVYLGALVAWYEAKTGKTIAVDVPGVDAAPCRSIVECVSVGADPKPGDLPPVVGRSFRLGDIPVIVRAVNADGSVRVRWCGGSEKTIPKSRWVREVEPMQFL